MGNEIVPYSNIEQLMVIGRVFVDSGMFADAGDDAKAVVKILAGQELGFSAFASMSGIHIIKGRVALSANLMASAVKRSGRYNYRVLQMEDDVCEIEFFERDGNGWESLGKSIFNAKDAQRAGTQNMNKFPRNMLFARAMSNGVKWYCPDVTGGPAYTPEELGAETDEHGDVVKIETLSPAALPAPSLPTICSDCEQPISDYLNMSAPAVANRSLERYGRALCAWCAQKAKMMPEWAELYSFADSLGIILYSEGFNLENMSLDKCKQWERAMRKAVDNRLEQLSEQSGVTLDDSLTLPEKVKQGLEMMEVITRAEMVDEAQR